MRTGFLSLYSVLAVIWFCFLGLGSLFYGLPPEGVLAYAVIAPIVVYVLCFMVLPWIVAGFRGRN